MDFRVEFKMADFFWFGKQTREGKRADVLG